jgi:dTDP-4-dehydrorhamnose 3,5-epimerase
MYSSAVNLIRRLDPGQQQGGLLSGEQISTASACAIPGVLRISLPGGTDHRGSFNEIFRLEWFRGVFGGEMQVNCSISEQGVLRGLHFHLGQTDLWYPCTGRIRAALADARPGSPAFGTTTLLDMEGGSSTALLIPPGVAHGFLALERSCLIYVVNSYYDGMDELGIAWDDPDLGIDWGCSNPLLSERDRSNPSFRSLGTVN